MRNCEESEIRDFIETIWGVLSLVVPEFAGENIAVVHPTRVSETRTIVCLF